MTERQRWGYEGLSDVEYVQFVTGSQTDVAGEASRVRSQEVPEEPAVSVTLESTATAVVRLGRAWRYSPGVEKLGPVAVAAANVALLRDEVTVGASPSPIYTGVDVELSRWAGLFSRLMADVDEERRRYTAAAERFARADVEASSSAGHVRGWTRAGRFRSLELDWAWGYQASDCTVAAEIADVLTVLVRRRSADPPPLDQMPAARTLRALVADPQRLLRFTGVQP